MKLHARQGVGFLEHISFEKERPVFGLISLAMTVAATVFGYLFSRAFVTSKLRFVDAIHSFAAPLVAGLGAILVASPVVWLLPLVGEGTAILFGLGVAAGVSSGAREIRKRIGSGSV